MRRWGPLAGLVLLLVHLWPGIARAQDVPVPAPPSDGFVLDTLGWFSAEQITALNASIDDLEKRTTAEIAIVTLDDCGADPTRFRNDVYRTWGIGSKEKSYGVLLLVCWYGGDKTRRTLAQEVGYGAEGVITDIVTRRTANDFFVPEFQSGDPTTDGRAASALMQMVERYKGMLLGEIVLTDPKPPFQLWQILLCMVVLILLFLILAVWINSGSNRGGSAGRGQTYSSPSTYTSSRSDDDDSGSSNIGGFGGGSSGSGGSNTGF